MRRRLTALGVAGLVLVAGLLVRVYAPDLIAQPAGTMLYAALVYVGVFVLRPGTSPVPAGLVAVGFCWLVEFAQLTGLPADLSERSLVARLVLGSEFDWADVAWYPVGVVPLVVACLILRPEGPGLRGA
ncbi:DUF2809 domain-containing protein [Pseudosporangium ferrugineum]|nr:DUF2809 domain-containing protein [Pseudosporangium ferrugineum]